MRQSRRVVLNKGKLRNNAFFKPKFDGTQAVINNFVKQKQNDALIDDKEVEKEVSESNVQLLDKEGGDSDQIQEEQ